MKILYFFDILDGNFSDLYLKLKKRELKIKIKEIKARFNFESISIYCMNKGQEFLSFRNFNPKILSIFNEIFVIDKRSHEELVNTVWTKVRNTFLALMDVKLTQFKHFLNIMEFLIVTEFIILYEKVELIKQIIRKQTPDIVIFSQKDSCFINAFIQKFKTTKTKFYYLKSNIDLFYFRFNKTFLYGLNLIRDFKNLFKLKISHFHQKKLENHRDVEIAISAPGEYLNSIEIKVLIKKLREKKIAFNLLSDLFNIDPTWKNINYKWGMLGYFKIVLRKHFKKSKIRQIITRKIESPLKDYVYEIVVDLFFNTITRIIYMINSLSRELERSNYRVLLIVNEFGLEGKITCSLCQQKGIIVYFIPYCGIPRRDSDLTPFYSDIICTDGEIDKDYLVKKGVNPEKIVIRGSPRYDDVLRTTVSSINKVFDHFSGKKYQISKKKKTIVFAANTFANQANEITLRNIINVLKKMSNTQLIIKLHPLQDGHFIKKFIDKQDFEAIIVKDVDIFQLIKSADIFLTEESSTILDGIVVGTPLICLDFTNKRVYFSAKHVYNDDKYIIRVQNEEQLFENLHELLNNKYKIEKYKKSLRDNLKFILYQEGDISSTERIIADLVKIMEDKWK